MKKTLAGINIQYPISRKILSGEKSVETRTYPVPKQYLNQNMALIETPGKSGAFKARVVAVIRFTECFKYSTKTEFSKDIKRHCVDDDSPWAWSGAKGKWGWRVEVVKTLKVPVPLKKRGGIRFTKNVEL